MKEIPILVPPIGEQNRIVARLESILAQIQTARTALDRIPAQLKSFRQSVLSAAISERWIDNNGTNQPDRLSLSQLIERIKTGPFGSALHKSDYVSDGIPIVNPMHINDGRIVPSDNMTITNEKADELSEYHLSPGDIVLARRGMMGRCAVVQAEQEGWLCGSGSMVLRPIKQVLPEYLQIFLSSPATVDSLEENSVGTTMSNLNQKILLDLEMFVPSLNDQRTIIKRIEQLLKYANGLEKASQAAGQQLDKLEQAALSKAFRGEL
jgi:type I restriction enzyme S subunit